MGKLGRPAAGAGGKRADGPRLHSHSPADFCQNWPIFLPLLPSEKYSLRIQRNMVRIITEIYKTISEKYISQDMRSAVLAGGGERGWIQG